MSITSFIACDRGFILAHMTVSNGFLVRSCLPVWLGMSPAAAGLVLAVLTTQDGQLRRCLPVALLTATDAMPSTKLLASFSTASPLWFSGAPVALS